MIETHIVVAMAKNRVIGRENGLPWHLPEDLKHFKTLTQGHPVVMGRLTYDSIGRPLPNRDNIVVTRQPSWSAEGVETANSLDQGLQIGRERARERGVAAVMLIGGATLYEQALPAVQKIYLTEIDAEVEGDAFFPKLNDQHWRELSRVPGPGTGGYPFAFVTLERCDF